MKCTVATRGYYFKRYNDASRPKLEERIGKLMEVWRKTTSRTQSPANIAANSLLQKRDFCVLPIRFYLTPGTSKSRFYQIVPLQYLLFVSNIIELAAKVRYQLTVMEGT